MHESILFIDGGLEVHGSFKKRNGNGLIENNNTRCKRNMKYL